MQLGLHPLGVLGFGELYEPDIAPSPLVNEWLSGSAGFMLVLEIDALDIELVEEILP